MLITVSFVFPLSFRSFYSTAFCSLSMKGCMLTSTRGSMERGWSLCCAVFWRHFPWCCIHKWNTFIPFILFYWIIILMNIQPDSSLTFLLFTKLEELVQNFVLIILCLCYHRALSLSYLNKTCSVQCFTRECNIMGGASEGLHNGEISFSPCFLLWMSTCIFCFTSIRTCLNTAEM